MTDITIRPGLVSDLSAIVRCHIDVWRATYSHLVEPALAAQLTDATRRQERWLTLLGDQDANRRIIVAQAADGIAGFGMFGEGDGALLRGAGEIKYLYVALAHQGRSIGKRLFGAMTEGLRDAGHHSVALGVVRGNEPAIAFYERIGGHRVGSYTDPGPLWRSDNLLYRWDDLPAVIARCQPAAPAIGG